MVETGSDSAAKNPVITKFVCYATCLNAWNKIPNSIFEVRLEAVWLTAFHFSLLNRRASQEVVKFDRFNGGDASFILRSFKSQPEVNVAL